MKFALFYEIPVARPWAPDSEHVAYKNTLEQAVTDLGKELHSQYVLSYQLGQETMVEPGFHHIKVIVDHPGLDVRTRMGYYWGGGAQ